MKNPLTVVVMGITTATIAAREYLMPEASGFAHPSAPSNTKKSGVTRKRTSAKLRRLWRKRHRALPDHFLHQSDSFNDLYRNPYPSLKAEKVIADGLALAKKRRHPLLGRRGGLRT